MNTLGSFGIRGKQRVKCVVGNYELRDADFSLEETLKRYFRGFLVVQWLVFCAPMQWVWVLDPVRTRSRMPQGRLKILCAETKIPKRREINNK